jgi:hypothetical protein
VIHCIDTSLIPRADPRRFFQLATIGDGPKIAVLRRLMDQTLKNESLFLQETNTAGYININYDDMDITDPVRMAQLWAAGCIAMLHIVRTGAGPHPLNPILLYLSIETDPSLLVNKDFIDHFDASTTGPFFTALGHVESRRFLEKTPFLKPFDMWLLAQRGRPVSTFMCTIHTS